MKKQEKMVTGWKLWGRKVQTPGIEGHQYETVYRCAGCGKTSTGYSIQLFGECWFCGGHRVHGGHEGLWMTLFMHLYLDVFFFNVLYWFRQRRKGGVSQ